MYRWNPTPESPVGKTPEHNGTLCFYSIASNCSDDCSFALWIVVLLFVELFRPDRLSSRQLRSRKLDFAPASDCCSEILSLCHSESGPLLGPDCLDSILVESPAGNNSQP